MSLSQTIRVVLSLVVLPCAGAACWGADWPQWLGPARNGSSPETGLLTQWPAAGPKVLWKVAGGDGYSSVAVAGERAFTLVQRGGDELAIALDAATGKELWSTRIGPAFKNNYGNGPRSTPSIAGDHVYVTSVTGPLVCLEAATGKVAWQKNILKEFGAENITWGLSASPLIEGDLVLVIPGAKGAGVAAFDKRTGAAVWKTSNDKAAYASPVALTVDGQRQAIFFTAAGLLAVQPKNGQEAWSIPWETDYDCNICTPLVIGDRLFVSSGEKVGCALFQLKANGAPETVWESRGPKSVMMNYWANSVVHGNYLYGVSGEFNAPISLTCVDLNTGKVMWKQERFGKASLTLADGHLFITTKPGDLVLVPATPTGYEEKARIRLLWDNRTAATIANKRLFLRDRQHIWCLDIAGK
ncbi:MAG: PQQ-binding-like beta-propeller repeat protein [Gemmataceae bacterium]